LFKQDKTSNSLKEKLIPLSNLIAGDLYIKLSTDYDLDYEDFFSAAILSCLNCLKRRDPEDFVNHKAFYSYIKSSSWFDARNIILTERGALKKESNIIDSGLGEENFFNEFEESESVITVDIRDTDDFILNKDRITKTYLHLTKIYPWKEMVCLRRFYFDFLSEKDRDPQFKCLHAEYSEDLEYPIIRIKELDKVSKVIFKMSLMHNMNEDFSLKKFPVTSRGEKEFFDKFFLVLACLDRYPFLTEMLAVLGTDKFFDFLKIFGGLSVNIPKISEVKRVSDEVDTYVSFLGSDTVQEITAVKGEGISGTTLSSITAIKSKVDYKLNSILRDAYTK